jgi:hypothetical protein
MNSDVKKEFNRLKGLVSLKDKPEAYIEKLAEKNVFVRELVHSGNFLDDEEKKEAKKLFDSYLELSMFENYADLQTLGQLVYNEILVKRIQKTINEQKTKENHFYINDKLVKSLHDTENQVDDIKKRLNLTKKDKKEDDLSRLEQMEKVFALEYAFNKHEFQRVCPSCGKILNLRRRCKDFETMVHPMFSGRFWYSRRGIQLVKDGVISKELYAYLFTTSTHYVDWCLEHEGEIVEVEGFTKEEIEEYLKQKPHLLGDKLRDSKEFKHA